MGVGLRPPRAAAVDHLRPPSPLDLLAHAYKDWLHLNVFVPSQGLAALVNVSLHGDAVAPSSMAVAAVAAHRVGGDPLAHVEIVEQREATVTSTSIAVGDIARIGLGDSGRLLSAHAVAAGVTLTVAADAVDRPIVAEHPVPFGRGWIAWRAEPRLILSGTLEVDGAAVDLRSAAASGYHDHNWGRWCWGDDAGWRWGTFPAVGDPPVTVTVAHRTDRHHRAGAPIARVQVGPLARDYPEGTVTIERLGRRGAPPLRLPGAAAALRSDRRAPALPERVVVRLDDASDRLEVRFAVDGALQLVNADPVATGHTFVHELFGTFEARGRIARQPVAGMGIGVFELVD